MPTEKEISKQDEENAQIVSQYISLRLKKGLRVVNPFILYKHEFEPIFEVTIKHTPGKSVDAFKELFHEISVVLNGKCSMSKEVKDLPPGGVYRNPTITFNVMGNPAHMIDDIRRRDPERFPQPKKVDG